MRRTGGERRTLQGLAAAIWVVLDEPLSPEAVADELRLLGDGTAPDLDAITRAVSLLEDHGVVEHEEP